jgi:diguanylate cyclase (GGDEF)-like protein
MDANLRAKGMIPRLQAWIVKSLKSGSFSERSGVLRFAVTRTLWTTIAAVLLNFVVYQVFGRLSFLAVTLPPDPWADSVVTFFVAAPICFLAYYTLGSAIMNLAISRDAFETLSRTDPLTGLLNRRAFTETVSDFNTPYAIAVIDIDRFKSINDSYGHGAGDLVLVEVANELRLALGEATLARTGGEEFAVAIPDRGRDAAQEMLEKARKVLEKRVFTIGNQQISVTFSAGLSRAGGERGFSSMLSDADKALYLAKAAGRNRVVHADDVLSVMKPGEQPPQQLVG